jgi:beta-lactamase superfamily II metal-dependent hydrolase
VSGQRRILIDSSTIEKNGISINPAYEYLRSIGATSIDLVVVTHLHRDHYSGIEDFLNNFDINEIAIPPFLSTKDSLFNNLIQRYEEKISEVIERTSDREIGKQMRSLASLIAYITKNDDKVTEATGPESVIHIQGASDLSLRYILPLKKIKGVLHHLITTGSFGLDSFPQMNDASIALLLEYQGYRVLLAGDSTTPQWHEHKRIMARGGISDLDATVLKVPHHGSKHNNTLDVYKYIFGTSLSGKSILISADGRSHPHNELFDLVTKHRLEPYCTNISTRCLPENVHTLKPLHQLPPEMLPFVQHYDVQVAPCACQGDIRVALDSSLTVSGSTGIGCCYSGSTTRVAWTKP